MTTVIDFAIPYGEETLADAFANWSSQGRAQGVRRLRLPPGHHRLGPPRPRDGGDGRRGLPDVQGVHDLRVARAGSPTTGRSSTPWNGARTSDAMLLVHAESSRVLDELIARHHTPELMAKLRRQAPRDHPPRLHRGRGDPAGHHLGRGHRRPALYRPYVDRQGDRHRQGRAGPRRGRLRRDLRPVPRPRRLRLRRPRRPPLRLLPAGQDAEAIRTRLWQGLDDGEVCVVSTDTCTFTREQKARWEGDWTKIPMGLPGLETLMPIVYTHGVQAGPADARADGREVLDEPGEGDGPLSRERA